MNSNKFVGNIALEVNQSGFYAIGHLTDENEKEKMSERDALDGTDVLNKILPKGEPVIQFTISRVLLLKILANLHEESEEWLSVSVYGKEKPIVIRGEEAFAIIMPARDNAINRPINIREEMQADQ